MSVVACRFISTAYRKPFVDRLITVAMHPQSMYFQSKLYTVTDSQKITPVEKTTDGWNKHERDNGTWIGALLVIIGGMALAKSFLFPIPGWLFNWQSLLIAIGLFIGLRNDFRGSAWLVMIMIGGVFLFKDYYFAGDLRQHAWPLILISLGAFFILRPGGSIRRRKQSPSMTGSGDHFQRTENFADMTILFGSARKNMVTKNFTGGDITSIFAGAELDLTNSDLQGEARIDITAIFGGAELIIPSDWIVKSDIVSVFGSVMIMKKYYFKFLQ